MPDPRLNEVFGISDHVRTASYVDRGGLDEELGYLLAAGRHIVIHGDSKQGKSWLRRHLLDEQKAVQVQCVSSSTPEGLLSEALGAVGVRATLKRTSDNRLEGQLELKTTTEAWVAFIARLRGEGKLSGTVERDLGVEEAPIAEHAANLEWVARMLIASDRRVVIEDFHYLPIEHRETFARWLKALGEHGLYLIIVGVWSDANFLTLYNGDLDGRVENIALTWSDDELEEVLVKGCDALNIEIEPTLRWRLVEASYGNVGLLQRLAERLCRVEKIVERSSRFRALQPSGSFEQATAQIANGMGGRYRRFASSFAQGPSGGRTSGIYSHLLRALLEFDDEELLSGVPEADLVARVEMNAPGTVRRRSLTNAIKQIRGSRNGSTSAPWSSSTTRTHAASS